jgi:hypothetical protein
MLRVSLTGKNGQKETFVPYSTLTAKLDRLVEIANLKRQTKDSESVGESSVIKIYPFVKTPVGIKKLLTDRFKQK